jgi:hypothetical protein
MSNHYSFSEPIPVRGYSFPVNTDFGDGGGDHTEKGENRSANRNELTKRTVYLAASTPILLACLYVLWLVYDAGFVYRELAIDIATARVMVQTTCNPDALNGKYHTDVIASTLSSGACQEAKSLSDCDQLGEFDVRFRKRREESGHWFTGNSFLLNFGYWVAVNILYNPIGAIGGVLLMYYITRQYWKWIPRPFLHACRDVYRSQRDSKLGLPVTTGPASLGKKTD